MATTQNNVILVIGSSGHVGSETVKKLKLGGNFVIRAGVRNIDKCKAKLGTDIQNVEVVHLDLDRPETIDAAFVGVTKVFLILGLFADRKKHTKLVVDACKRFSVSHLLFLSVVNCQSKSLALLQNFRECEELIEGSGLVWTFLRTVFYQENFLYYSKWIQQGFLGLPIDNAKFAPLSNQDLSDAASFILLGNVYNHSYKICDLTGPELLDGISICNILSQNLGINVAFKNISMQEAYQQLLSLGFSDIICKGFLDLYDVIAKNLFAIISRDGEMLLGRNMTSFDTMVKKNKDLFLSPAGLQQQQYGQYAQDQIRQQQYGQEGIRQQQLFGKQQEFGQKQFGQQIPFAQEQVRQQQQQRGWSQGQQGWFQGQQGWSQGQQRQQMPMQQVTEQRLWPK